jgi:NAD(P)-dependent dehydrogenase (short-subunit alcohol dehydrogenase family)
MVMERLACVTGADRGLGLGLVKELLNQHYKVFAGRYDQGWNGLAELKQLYPGQLELVDLDIADDASVKEAKQFIIKHTDQLDILINNAAMLGDIKATLLDQLDFVEMQTVFNVTALGALRVSNALIPLILQGSQKLIVNISSEAGSIGACYRTSWFAYSMAKAALNMQSAIIHNQLKTLGGQVLAIHPGWVKTYMEGQFNEAAHLTADQSAQHILQIIANHKQYQADNPAFIDYNGNELPW